MRVISGKARGVNLKTPDGLQTRPTADRVKEAVFSILQFDIPGASVLDLFSLYSASASSLISGSSDSFNKASSSLKRAE